MRPGYLFIFQPTDESSLSDLEEVGDVFSMDGDDVVS